MQLLTRFALLFLVLTGCADRKKSADDVSMALQGVDCAGLYSLLSPATQKSIDAAYRSARLQRTIVTTKFPPDKAAAALAGLAAAGEPDAKHYFVALCSERNLVQRVRVPGAKLRFCDTLSAGFRLCEYENDWQLEAERSARGVQTIRDNAALYLTEEKERQK